MLKRDGLLYIPVHERLFWLRRACDERRGATHWTARFQHAISELRAVLRKGIRTQLEATSSTAEALRDALGLESEGEGEGKGEEMDKKAANTLGSAPVLDRGVPGAGEAHGAGPRARAAL